MPLPPRAELTDRLAELLSTPDGLKTVRLLTLVTRSDHRAPRTVSPPDGPVGIWEPRPIGSDFAYVRVDRQGERLLWADVESIAPKDGRRRVVLLGESVARGFYYDPHYRPAMALEQALGGSFEVIDLARIGCRLEMLRELSRSCLAMRPDCIVVFAGNNWHPYASLDRSGLHELAAVARRGSWREVRRYLENLLAGMARSFVSDTAAALRKAGVPWVVVIPEFNLAGWRSEFGVSAPFASADCIAVWEQTRARAERALAQGKIELAASLARKLVECDDGTSPVGLEMLGRCAVAQGDLDGGREFFESARDSDLSLLSLFRTPRCLGVVQKNLRTSCAELGVPVVDLPRLFRDYLGGVPDHRLFHDYCHLTSEGIEVAMRSAASAIHSALEIPPGETAPATPGLPSPRVAAEAHLLAAVHNAHWGQDYDTVVRHCLAALQAWPPIRETMSAFLDSYIRRAPSVLCSSFVDHSPGDGCMADFFAWNADPYTGKLLNRIFLRALTFVLRPDESGVEGHVDALLGEEHGVSSRETDLLAIAYSESRTGSLLPDPTRA